MDSYRYRVTAMYSDGTFATNDYATPTLAAETVRKVYDMSTAEAPVMTVHRVRIDDPD